MNNIYDLIIIGGGPAGYVAAIRSAQFKMKTLVLEKNKLGGTCLNIGCIPTKTLFQSAEVANTVIESANYGIASQFKGIDFETVMQRKDRVVAQLVDGVKYLLAKNKVSISFGEAKLISSKKVMNKKTGETFEGENILIATGSINNTPPIKGIDGKNILGSTELLNIKKIPKSLAIIGGGVIGCEFADIFDTFGCKVTIIEVLPKILMNMDNDCSEEVSKEFKAKGINIIVNTKVNSISDSDDGTKEINCLTSTNESLKINAECILVATGREPSSKALGLEEIGVSLERGFIKVDDYMKTSVEGIYAAGDVTGRSFLAHAAYEEGIVAVENMKGFNRKMNFNAIPRAVFVKTEVSSVGLNEDEAKEKGYDVIIGKFNLTASGKALSIGKNKGFIKVISESRNHEILGIHIAGAGATELVTVGASLINMEAVLEDVADTIYPHPSISEAIREACLDALKRAIHS